LTAQRGSKYVGHHSTTTDENFLKASKWDYAQTFPRDHYL